MLKIHQPYIKRKVRMTFAFASIGVLLLSLGILIASPATHPSSHVYAAGDSRTIHDISDMQEMTEQICSNTDIGDTETLVDRRGTDISYKVIRMLDGTCWMAKNLRLINTKITKDNSDITSEDGFTIPASDNGFGYDMSETDGLAKHAYYNNDITYGAYYNWHTATAGTTTDSNGDAAGSICPKGWKLPAFDGAESFYNIIKGSNGYEGSWSAAGGKNGRKLGYISDDAFWPAAGNVYNGSLNSTGSYGNYWSRRAASDSSYAYRLLFYSSNVYPHDNVPRYNGFPVRCVAPGGLEKIEKPTWSESKDGNVTVTMPSIISIDATSGMDETANAAEIAEGTATATISSNTEHTVTLHSTQPSLKDPKITSAEISPVSATNLVQPGHNAWGFWDGTRDSSNKSYTLPVTTTPQEFYNTTETVTNTEGNPATKHTYYVGISISPSLPSGTYATDVIITASTK